MSACRACRDGRCEDCATLSLYCDCCSGATGEDR